MASNIINEDLRIIKTRKALYAAMFALLKNHSFKKITIKEICEEALVSRVTFYTHFIDKYDLLKHWMAELWPEDLNDDDNYEQFEKSINCHIHENRLIFKNLVYDADNETFGILFDFILSTINLSTEKNEGKMYPENIVLSNFYAGGVISYFLWQIRNKFPPDVPPMNKCLYKMIHELQEWQSE